MRFKFGNILDAEEEFIAHGCNAQGVMGSGVAKALRDKWPKIYTPYRGQYEVAGLSLGDVIPAPLKDKVIFNVITQKYYGSDGFRYANYAAISKGLSRVLSYSKGNVAVPLIGGGLGGCNKQMIVELLKDIEKVVDNGNEFVLYVNDRGDFIDITV